MPTQLTLLTDHKAQASRTVILVHGIRDRANWMEFLGRAITNHDPRIDVKFYIFPWYDLLSFAMPIARGRIVAHFSGQLDTLCKQVPPGHRIDIIAHSFGTYVVATALRKLLRTRRVKVNTLILCGSVLRSSFDWTPLTRTNKVKRVINDCGFQDVPLILSQLLIYGTGMAGRTGFQSDISSNAITNRWFKFGHNGFFSQVGFYRDYWIPLLASDAPPAPVDQRPREWPLKDRVLLTIINSAEPAKLALYFGVPLLLAAIAVLGYLYGKERNRAATASDRAAQISNAVAGESKGVALLLDLPNTSNAASEAQAADAQKYFTESAMGFKASGDIDGTVANKARAKAVRISEPPLRINGSLTDAGINAARSLFWLAFEDGSVKFLPLTGRSDIPDLPQRQYMGQIWPRGVAAGRRTGVILSWDHEPQHLEDIACPMPVPALLRINYGQTWCDVVLDSGAVEFIAHCEIRNDDKYAAVVTTRGSLYVVCIESCNAEFVCDNVRSLSFDNEDSLSWTSQTLLWQKLNVNGRTVIGTGGPPVEATEGTFSLLGRRSVKSETSGNALMALNKSRTIHDSDRSEVVDSWIEHAPFDAGKAASSSELAAKDVFEKSIQYNDGDVIRSSGSVDILGSGPTWVALKHGDEFVTVSLPGMSILRWGGFRRSNKWAGREAITNTCYINFYPAIDQGWMVSHIANDHDLEHAEGFRLWHRSGRIITEKRIASTCKWKLDVNAVLRAALMAWVDGGETFVTIVRF